MSKTGIHSTTTGRMVEYNPRFELIQPFNHSTTDFHTDQIFFGQGEFYTIVIEDSNRTGTVRKFQRLDENCWLNG